MYYSHYATPCKDRFYYRCAQMYIVVVVVVVVVAVAVFAAAAVAAAKAEAAAAAVDLGFMMLLSSQVISVVLYSEREKSEKFFSEVLISV